MVSRVLRSSGLPLRTLDLLKLLAAGGALVLVSGCEKSAGQAVSSGIPPDDSDEVELDSSASATLTGRISDDRGRPVAFATVRMSWPSTSSDVSSDVTSSNDADRRHSSWDEKRVESDVNGAFRLDGIPVGRHRLWVEAEGFEDFESVPIVHLAADDLATAHELPPLMVQLQSRQMASPPDRERAGIGIILEALTYELLVVDVLADGGAADAGIRVGDRIITVDGQPVSEIGAAGSLERLAGKEGSTVEVEMVPKGAKSSETIRVERKRSLRDSLG